MTAPGAESQTATLPPRTLRASDLSGGRGARTLYGSLNFAVEPGRLLLLRGPNGAGKTSLLLTLAGIVRPFSGTLVIEGADPDTSSGIDIAYFGHRPAIKPRLSVLENLTVWGALYRAPAPLRQAALNTVGLGGIADLDAGYLSAGQTRRLALARLIIARRPIWLLDEPFAALDAEGETLVVRLIEEHLEQGGSAIAATHHDLAVRTSDSVSTLALGVGI